MNARNKDPTTDFYEGRKMEYDKTHDGKELNMRGKIDIIKAVKNIIHYNGMPWR